jgi:hypothetical protein
MSQSPPSSGATACERKRHADANKWDLRFLKSEEVFDTTPYSHEVLNERLRFLALGDGLFVAADEVDGSMASFRFALWARSTEHFRHLFLSNANHREPAPSSTVLEFNEPPDVPKPLTYEGVTASHNTNGIEWGESEIGFDFHYREIDMMGKVGVSYMFLSKRAKKHEPVAAVVWRHRL